LESEPAFRLILYWKRVFVAEASKSVYPFNRDGEFLTAAQSDHRGSHAPKPRSFGAVALLCLALLVLLVTVQVAHNHLIESDADHCTLCVALHSAAPVAAMAAAVVLVRMGRAAQPALARPLVRHWNPKLFTRPPPSGL
jgi:hypothetical protein